MNFFQKKLRDFRGAARLLYALFEKDGLYRAVESRLSLLQEGKDIMRFLKKNRIPLVLLHENTSSCCRYTYIKDESGRIKFCPQQIELASENPDKIFSSVFHEGRHVRQAIAGVISPSQNVSPEDFLWHNHVVEADAETEAVFTAFKMKLSGHPEPFEYKKTKGWSAAMCKTAEDQYAKNPGSLDTPEFRRMIFDTWFEMPHVEKRYTDEAISGWKTFNRFVTENNFPKATGSLDEVEKVGLCGGESVNYLTLPGFRRLDDTRYKCPGALLQAIELQVMTQEWQGPQEFTMAQLF